VWQYIKISPYSEDLKKILASEMQDNVGMCAQGNLSRLCNILSGYFDGINPEIKSRNEILAERLAALMSVDDVEDRIYQANLIFTEMNATTEEREIWSEPIMA
jgi:hypothetical protein